MYILVLGWRFLRLNMDAIVAARYNSVWQLKRSLEAGADPNTIDNFQMTPLLYAIEFRPSRRNIT